jgi:hypothetical protein
MTDKDKPHAPPPTSKTVSPAVTPAPEPSPALPPEAYMTEQEKAAIANQPATKKETK